jgi:hypothetical protein
MRSGTGTYTKARSGTFVGAHVRVDFTALEGGELEVRCSPRVFSELGPEVNPEAPGFAGWRRGAEMGLRAGSELAGVSSGRAEIRSILGTFVDTSEGAVAAAAALALWEALGFEPPASARARLDEIVIQHPFPFGAAP